jgi:hypothetical protein
MSAKNETQPAGDSNPDSKP